ncbi:MAG: thioredoxin domain-containing protein, partial [Longimicrobiales bacterium]
MSSPPAVNRLADEPSPFLQHGAQQPVAWMPWGAEAFDLAREQSRPILLDIGAVWCHWCHVMDRESYEDAETAALINELFVPVKVDRDERPDVDARYQRAVQTMSGQGGWPLTAFLTPDGRAFYGGTYFPPADMHGRPSFRRVLGEVARVWRDDRERALESATQILQHLERLDADVRRAGELDPGLVDFGADALAQTFDFRHGGFGQAPKFPNAGALLLLLDRWIDGKGEDWARRIVAETLRAMADGGIHDQLGGGFHRYTVDARWLIPHFEKMAGDNGPLLECYARAAAALDERRLADVARGIVAYYREIAPTLLADGGFAASQDADISDRDDGDYWTWTEQEVLDAADGEERLARAGVLRFGV